jgi:valyl-tRNA synthetase
VVTLRIALAVINRLLAPFIPFAAEEMWSWWQQGSVHQAPWPTKQELDFDGNPDHLRVLTKSLAVIRKAKSDQKLSMKAEIDSAELAVESKDVELAADLLADLKLVGRIKELKIVDGDYELKSVVFS